MIHAPRWPGGRAVPAVRDLEIADDRVHADLDVTQAHLAGAAGRNVRLERVWLRDTDLSRARLERLILTDVRLERCDLANGFWRNAEIDRTELIDCRLTGLDLADASLRHVLMRQCQGALISFRSATLKHSRVEDCALTEADFQDAQLPGLVVRGSDLRGASLYGANLQGPTCAARPWTTSGCARPISAARFSIRCSSWRSPVPSPPCSGSACGLPGRIRRPPSAGRPPARPPPAAYRRCAGARSGW